MFCCSFSRSRRSWRRKCSKAHVVKLIASLAGFGLVKLWLLWLGQELEDLRIPDYVFIGVGMLVVYAVSLPFSIASIAAIVQVAVLDERWLQLLDSYHQTGQEVDGILADKPNNNKHYFWITYKVDEKQISKHLHVEGQDKEHLLNYISIPLVKLPDNDFSAVPLSKLKSLRGEMTMRHRRLVHVAASVYLMAIHFFILWFLGILAIPDLDWVVSMPLRMLVGLLLTIQGFLVHKFMIQRHERITEAMENSGQCVMEDDSAVAVDMEEGTSSTKAGLRLRTG